jgi:hypothetical protein
VDVVTGERAVRDEVKAFDESSCRSGVQNEWFGDGCRMISVRHRGGHNIGHFIRLAANIAGKMGKQVTGNEGQCMSR